MNNETTTAGAQGAAPMVSIGNYLTHLDETKRGLAKLLARENITVSHAHVSTAMFNVETRELVLPKFDKVTVDQYDLLIGHEVGHAKYSQDLQVLKDCIEFPGLKTYVNVLEDTRIERLMKAEYPGLRGSFRRGYADFAAFGPLFRLEAPIETYSFIDRVNLHYKIGASVAVPFSQDEAAVLPRIDMLHSMRAVYVLAKELWESDKAAAQDAAEAERAQQGSNGEPSDSSKPDAKSSGAGAGAGAGDQPAPPASTAASDAPSKADSTTAGDQAAPSASPDTQSNEMNGAATQSASPTTSQGPHAARDAGGPVARTDVANDEALKTAAAGSQMIRDGVAQVQLSPLSAATIAKHMVSNAQFVADITTYCAGLGTASVAAYGDKYLTEFTAKHGATIRFMVREFELRKAAKLANRAKSSRTGRLDVSKLYAYKFREDLFKSVITIPNGQSHGVVVLIDASGSMNSVMSETIDQALLFGSFAKQAGIPFRALTFTTVGHETNATPRDDRSLDQVRGGTLVPTPQTQVVTILDTTAPNWKAQIHAVALTAAVHASRNVHNSTWAPGYNAADIIGALRFLDAMPHTRLGMTPLYSALLLVDHAVASLKAAHRLDKMTLLVVTDGDDSDGVILQTANSHRVIARYVHGAARHIRGTVTRKQYADYTTTAPLGESYPHGRPVGYVSLPNAVLSALVDSLQTRHDARVVSIKLVPGREMERATKAAERVVRASQDDAAPSLDPWTMSARARRASRRHEETLWMRYGRSFATPHADLTSAPDETAALATIRSTGQFNLPTKDIVGNAAIIISTKRLDMAPETIDTTPKGSDAATTRSIIKQFVTQNIKASRNKVFVNTVMPYLA